MAHFAFIFIRSCRTRTLPTRIGPQSAMKPGAAWAQSGLYFELHCFEICEKFFPK